MRIIHVATELAPLAKAGGLGDVVSGLAKECGAQGHSVQIILPFYDVIDRTQLTHLQQAKATLSYTAYSAQYDSLNLVLLDLACDAFKRGTIYGGVDEVPRFLKFNRAVLEYFSDANIQADILHLHDWPTAALAGRAKERFCMTLLSVHNLDYQGHATFGDFIVAGLSPNRTEFNTDREADINLLASGIEQADACVCVSPTYAQEVQSKAHSRGLYETIHHFSAKFHGILNGIDTTYWNPHTDPLIATHLEKDFNLFKQKNRAALIQKLGLKDTGGPLICAVTRLVAQKAPHLIAHAARYTLDNDGLFVLLGTTDAENLRSLFPPHPRLHAHFVFDEPLSHLTFAGADAIVIPSLFEPCGLTQMLGMRYGTVPIARATGGLIDTVFDTPHSKTNGFLFDDPTPQSLDHAMNRAWITFHTKPKEWLSRIQKGLKCDFSWTGPARRYLELYASLTKHRG